MFDLPPVLDANANSLFAPSITFLNEAGSTNGYEKAIRYLKFYYQNQSKERSIKLLEEILALEKNWNGNNADKFEPSLVNKVKEIVKQLDAQPKIFPTGDDSIQLEYEKESGDYLEFEIFSDRIKCYSVINQSENTVDLTSTSQIKDTISRFYA